MQEKSKGTLVFALVAVLALGSAVAGAGLGGGARAKLGATEARLLAERPVPAARGEQALAEYRFAKSDLQTARTAAQAGHRGAEAIALVSVIDRAERIDRGGTLWASLIAAKLFDTVAEHVDAAPVLLGDARLVAALRRSSFGSSRHPLEAERRHAVKVLAGVPAQLSIRTAGFAEATATQAMEDVNATLHAMEDAAIAGNIEQCETAAQETRGLAKHVTVGPSICKSAAFVVASGNRFRELRARATRA